MPLGLGLGQRADKKEASSAEWPMEDRKILRRCMRDNPHTSKSHTLYGQGRRAMKCDSSPQTAVDEGAYAIKVSMHVQMKRRGFYRKTLRTDQGETRIVWSSLPDGGERGFDPRRGFDRRICEV